MGVDGCDGVIRPRPAAGVLVTVSLDRGQRWPPYPGLRRGGFATCLALGYFRSPLQG